MIRQWLTAVGVAAGVWLVRWTILHLALVLLRRLLRRFRTHIDAPALPPLPLAVALALHPTLTNLFAGISILLSNRIRVGDYVELDSGQAGVVTDVGWRSTLVEELAGNTFVIPNSKFAEMVLKNYNLPVSQNAL